MRTRLRDQIISARLRKLTGCMYSVGDSLLGSVKQLRGFGSQHFATVRVTGLKTEGIETGEVSPPGHTSTKLREPAQTLTDRQTDAQSLSWDTWET